MKLEQLLKDAARHMPFSAEGLDMSAEITGITDDTRKLDPYMIFVCVKGANFDGHTAAEEMIAMGAACVVTERDLGLGSRQIVVSDSRRFYGILCAAWFGHPERKMNLIGVTGTNGKTTMTSMITAMLESKHKKVGLIGTTGAYICGKPIDRDDSTPTTPRVFELYGIFDRMVKAGCEYVVMEVTSFALDQNRIGPARFKIGVFTNLTQDHLDYHKTMESYYNAKKRLFTECCDTAVINTEDPYGQRLFSEISCVKYSYGIKKGCSLYADNISSSGNGMKFWIYVQGKENATACPVTLNMVGSFNVLNAAAAISVCLKLGMTVKDAAAALAKFGGVRGRCEIIPTGQDFTVVCDYAHSPDALEKMLPGVRENTKGRLICLFGCGGDRDSTKRPLMAQAVEKYADHIIVTSDNPRNEDPEAIIDDIVAGFSEKASYERIADRREAILHGIRIAKKNDVLVLAGKGHEDYQILADGKHIHFDEREVVAECIKKIFGKPAVVIPEKKEPLTLDEVCRAVGGKPFGMNYSPNTVIYASEISSDSRTVKKGALFFGIKGENFDGTAFAEKAVNELGAVCAVTDRIVKNTPCIVVPDTRKALLDLAGHFRRKYSPVVVGVTGSVGKTTSKDLLYCALSSELVTMKTEGNRNNDIGLPFTLFRLNSDIKAAVIEMGMSHSGEISALSKAARPDICVITNIGFSHIENLGSKQGILKAKLEILDGAKPDAPLLVNGDDPFLYAQRNGVNGHKVITCGVDNPNADYRAVNILSEEDRVEFDIAYSGLVCAHCELPVTGKHYIIDALLAAVAAKLAGCSVIGAADSLKKYVPTGLRQHIVMKNGQKLIIDCYNAAPVSMKAAIDVLCSVEKPVEEGKRICVFGDMLELGEMSERLHRDVGRYAAEKGVDLLVCFGKLTKYAAESAKAAGIEAAHTENFSALKDFLKMNTREGDVILFKGSRAMKLENIVTELYGKDV